MYSKHHLSALRGMYEQNKTNENTFCTMSNLQTYCPLKLDYQKAYI